MNNRGKHKELETAHGMLRKVQEFKRRAFEQMFDDVDERLDDELVCFFKDNKFQILEIVEDTLKEAIQ